MNPRRLGGAGRGDVAQAGHQHGGEKDIAFFVTDAAGYVIDMVDENYNGLESYAFTTELEAPYFVNVYQYAPDFHFFSLESSHKLAEYPDFDDSRGIVLDQSHAGCLDYPGDFDNFLLSLKEGEKVNILVDSIMIDPLLSVGLPGAYGEGLVEDDDTGGGVFGSNAEMTFIAPDSGTYLLSIHDANGFNIGGYTLHVRKPYSGGPTPVAPLALSQMQPISTDYGPMWPYESDIAGFTMMVPAGWNDQLGANFGELAALCEAAQLCLAGEGLLMISEEDLSGTGEWTTESYESFYINLFGNLGFTVRNRRSFVTESGLEGRIVVLDFGQTYRIIRFMALQDDVGLNVAYLIDASDEEALRPLIEYTFSTINVGG